MSLPVSLNNQHFSAVAGTSESTAVAPPELPKGLSADSLLIYCQTMIGSLEEEIDGMLKEQMANLGRKKALSDVEAVMKEHQPPKSEEDVQAIEKAFDDAITSLPKDDPTRKALEATKEKTMAALDPPNAMPAQLWGIEFTNPLISNENWQGHISAVTNLKDDVSDNAQLSMIKLQSMTAQHQTMYQLTTNTLAKVNQTLSGIAANFK